MEFDKAVAELDTLVETLERDGDERALLLLQLIDAVHRPALELIVGGELDHPVAHALLAMYDLAPVDEHVEVEEALDEIRPYIESHGGGLDLIGVDADGGIVHVRMHGSCHGCAASAMTLRRGIETKLRERLDWFTEVVAHEPEPAAQDAESESGIAAKVLQIERYNPALGDGTRAATRENGAAGGLLQIEDLRRPVFAEVGSVADLPPGTTRAVTVGEHPILLVNVDGEPYAFRNVCALDGRSELTGSRLTGSVLVCPWHNCAYDARSGKRVDDPGEAPLAVVPIAVRDGVLQVAANVA